VKAVVDAVLVEPVARFLDGIAVFDSVESDQCPEILVVTGCAA